MKNILFLLLLLWLIPTYKIVISEYAVNSNNKERVVNDLTNRTSKFKEDILVGKNFILGQSTKKENCEIAKECDCCSSELLFLSLNKFLMIESCTGNEYLTRGKYYLKNDELILDYEQNVISYSYILGSKTDNSEARYLLSNEKMAISKSRFKIGSCNGLIKITDARIDKDGLKNAIGFQNMESTIDEKILLLKEKKIWKHLNL